MCNHYSMRGGRAAILDATRAMFATDDVDDAKPEVYPNRQGLIVRQDAGGERVLTTARWGLPTAKNVLLKAADDRMAKERIKREKKNLADLTPEEVATFYRMEPDSGVTNVRNVISQKTGQINRHWAPWLKPENRCLVPFTAFAEPDQVGRTYKNQWFALAEDMPLAFFAGIWIEDWTCVRTIKAGMETCDVFGFLTTEPQAEVSRFHDKASVVVLRSEDEREVWLRAPWDEAGQLQRPAPPGAFVHLGEGRTLDDI